VTVSGEFDKQPTISVPKGKPPATTDVKVISRGSGPALKSGDLAVVDGYGRTWDDATTFENTYTSDAVPDTLPVGTGQIALTGLDKALLGVPTGSRVLIVLPPKEGFGLASQLPTGVQKTDTAVLVFDVLGGYQSNAGPSGQQVSSGGGDLPTVTSAGVNQKPTVAIPKSDPPAKLSVTTLVKGDGPAVAKGQELVVQYLGQIWASGNEFDSSWKRGQPTAFTVGAGQLIQAWDDGLVGVPVGSRVLIVAPPDSAYGAAGQPSAGIAGTDTLVFVVDVLGAYSP
jgi:peptidylprolyl isomerase